MAHAAQSVHTGDAAIDPVCGMAVDPAKTAHRHTVDRRVYFFCSAGCRSKFAADPDKYLKEPGGGD